MKYTRRTPDLCLLLDVRILLLLYVPYMFELQYFLPGSIRLLLRQTRRHLTK